MTRRNRLLTFLLAALPTALAAQAAPAAAPAADDWRLCRAQSAEIARDGALPRHLLEAIGAVEAGRWHPADKAVAAWPWTVTAEGEGKFLPSHAAAIAHVEALRARGVRNIDVGCMQINLRYHPEAFASLEEAFDPALNLRYAARFLGGLRARYGSWTAAIGRYHSSTPRLSGPYRVKVFRAWRTIKHRHNRARLAARLEEARGITRTP